MSSESRDILSRGFMLGVLLTDTRKLLSTCPADLSCLPLCGQPLIKSAEVEQFYNMILKPGVRQTVVAAAHSGLHPQEFTLYLGHFDGGR